jgi:hypothetical protein
MGRSKLLGTVVGLILLSAIAMPDALAHTFVADSTISIGSTPKSPVEKGTDVLIFGKVRSDHASCKKGRVVELFRVKSGQDKLLGKDKTDADGEYGFDRTIKRDQKFRTKVLRRLDASYSHSHDCKGAGSSKLVIRVA